MTAHDDVELIRVIRELLRSRAHQLTLDPASITSPAPSAITGRTADGGLVRLDVSTYPPAELSR